MRFKSTALSTALFVALLWGTAAWSDTFRLSDGTVVICKIIDETDTHYVIANSYGTFTVKKKNVKEKYVTRTYKEDVKIQQKMNIKVDENVVKKNIEEGVKKKKEKEEADRKKKKEARVYVDYGKRDPDWFFGRMGLTLAYYGIVSGRVSSKVPGGFSVQLSYDQGLEGLFKKGHRGIPGIRFEAGFLDLERSIFFNSPQRVDGFFAQAGPVWMVPAVDNRWGCIVLGALPGGGYFNAVNSDVSKKSSNGHFIFTLLAGYEYSIQSVSLAAHVRYLFIMDRDKPLHAIGGSLGFTYRLWTSPVLK